MKRTGIMVFGVMALLAFMEGVSWWAYTRAQGDKNPLMREKAEDVFTGKEGLSPAVQTGGASAVPPNPASTGQPLTRGAYDLESFPPPSVARVSGRTERTIHMGVRQYVWEPAVIQAKQGEVVRLIIHNADVKHGLVIPDLGVNEDIPEEGAVVEFTASKAGTFEFFCSVWCGEGHVEMRGSLIIGE